MVLLDPSFLLAALNIGHVLRRQEPTPSTFVASSVIPEDVTASATEPLLSTSAYGDGPAYLPSSTAAAAQAPQQAFSVMDTTNNPACSPPPYDVPPLPIPQLPPPDPALATVYRYRQQQGVNLGSWFMLEQWMVPSLFICASFPQVSEFDVAAGWNGDSKSVLERHWDSFVTEGDFAWLASIGINTVRLPLGYWHVGQGNTDWVTGTMYEGVRHSYEGAWPRVLRAINWAAKYGIGVLVDLHGAPGSQNGQQHSGVSDGQTNLFSSPSNIIKTISVLEFLTRTFVNVPNVVGIQILNEPNDTPEVWDFYNAALNAVRAIPGAESFPFYLHDAFNLDKGAGYVMSRGREFNILDHHAYYVFTPQDDAEPASGHTTDVSSNGWVGQQLMNNGMKLNGNLVIGEWSCALTDQSMSGESDPVSARKQFCETQEATYRDVGAGAAFWSLTKENCDGDPGWCFKSAVGNALPTSFFSYKGLTVAKTLTDTVGATTMSFNEQSPVEEGNHRPASPPVHPLSWAGVASTAISQATESPSATLNQAQATSVSSADALQVLTTIELSPSVSVDSLTSSAAAAPNKRHEVVDSAHAMHGRRQDWAMSIHHKRHSGRRFMNRRQDGSDASSIDSPASSSTTGSTITTETVSAAQVTNLSTLTPAQQAIQRGFSDGFMTAKMFAQQGPGMSRLGFKWQYVEDSLAAHGQSVIQPGKEGYYREWFDRGLAKGEEMVESVIARITQ